MELQNGDLVLCTVEKVERTNVFVKIHVNGKDIDGSIVISEIAPGRIRNIRSYVVPKKTIVCKVLRVTSSGNVELSLRRVTPKEKKEVMEEAQQEKSYEKIIKRIAGDKADDFISEIRKKDRLYDFMDESRENPKMLEKIFGKENAKKILDILLTQKSKSAYLRKEISLSTNEPNGIELIKEAFKNVKDADITYISAGKYSVKTESENVKSADKKLKEILEGIEDFSKKNKMVFEITR